MANDRQPFERVREVLERGYLMSLGTQDDGGVWVCDVIFIFDRDFILYWMSDPDARHSVALRACSEVAATITVNGPGEPNFGIQIGGVADELEGRRYDLAVKHFVKRRKAPPSKMMDVLQGDRWYRLRPGKIELIDEASFGFEKRQLQLPKSSVE